MVEIVQENIDRKKIETELRSLGTPYEQYCYLIKNRIPFYWPEDSYPSGIVQPTKMVGDMPRD